MNTLLKIMKNDKTPALRNLICLPLMLCPDIDEGMYRPAERHKFEEYPQTLINLLIFENLIFEM